MARARILLAYSSGDGDTRAICERLGRMAAFAGAIDGFGPGEYFHLSFTLRKEHPSPSPDVLLAAFKLGDWDGALEDFERMEAARATTRFGSVESASRCRPANAIIAALSVQYFFSGSRTTRPRSLPQATMRSRSTPFAATPPAIASSVGFGAPMRFHTTSNRSKSCANSAS